MTFNGYKPKGSVVTEDRSRNGVRFIVTTHYDALGEKTGTTVDASCDCYGSDFRIHSDSDCLNRKRQIRAGKKPLREALDEELFGGGTK